MFFFFINYVSKRKFLFSTSLKFLTLYGGSLISTRINPSMPNVIQKGHLLIWRGGGVKKALCRRLVMHDPTTYLVHASLDLISYRGVITIA